VFQKQKKASVRGIELSGEAGNIFNETISNIRTVVAFGGEQKEIQKYVKFPLIINVDRYI